MCNLPLFTLNVFSTGHCFTSHRQVALPERLHLQLLVQNGPLKQHQRRQGQTLSVLVSVITKELCDSKAITSNYSKGCGREENDSLHSR